MDLNDYWYFVHVVEKQGFAAAGRALNVPKSRLSRHVQALEDRLGVRLIQRTSRQFAVTEVGDMFYRHARAALDDVDTAEALVRQSATGSLAGTVRISCSVGIAQFAVSKAVTGFLKLHPGVSIRQQAINRTVDLIEEGVDMVLRGHAGPLPDSDLIQKPLVDVPWRLFASASCVEAAGGLTSPDAFNAETVKTGSVKTDSNSTDPTKTGAPPAIYGLQTGWQSAQAVWTLDGPDGRSAQIPFVPRLASDDMSTLKAAACAGLGVVALPAYVCRNEVRDGSLVRVLPDWCARRARISLLMPSRKGVLPVVRAFADYLADVLPRELAEPDCGASEPI
ncbi:LysR substrate-binding domain-containing protein [Maricaulis sp. D1M11]|uniref:LysR substrate-binding domain-containing protein n=1 Tax=Maricaulis sp. D1M11 TaxID=3076117 RepID=UPI0039B4E862